MENKQKIEVCRSYSEKVNLGNYQMADFFMSCKAECSFEEVDQISNELYHVCRQIVEKDIEAYKQEKEAENTIDFDKMGKKLTKTYSNQPPIKRTYKNKGEEVEESKREWLMQNNHAIKGGD